MLRRRMLWALVAAAVAGSWWVGSAISQPGGRRGRDRRWNPEDMRRRMEEFRRRGQERMREQLGASEEEWKVLLPLIEKVQQLQQQQQQGGGTRFGDPFGRRGRRPGDRRSDEDEAKRPEVEKKTEALRSLLEDEVSGAGAIKAALDALRKARLQAEQELAKARKELQQVVTVRQEAQLVLMGILK